MLRRWKIIANFLFFYFCLVLSCISIFSYFIQRDSITGTCSLLGGINVSFSASSFNEARHFKGCFLRFINQSSWKLSICKCVIIGKGCRALPYTKLKLMLCAFQPYIKLNFGFLWRTCITFSQSGSHTRVRSSSLAGSNSGAFEWARRQCRSVEECAAHFVVLDFHFVALVY